MLDGNRNNQNASSHGFRSGGATGLNLRGVIIRNTFSYGIGLEGGKQKDILIEDCVIEDTGADGIDIKNKGLGILAYDGGVAPFSVSNTVTGATSGASGKILNLEGDSTSGTLYLDLITNNGMEFTDFQDNEVLQVGGVTKAVANGTLDREQNENIQIVRPTVRRWGLSGDATQAAIDCRGPVQVIEPHISEPNAVDAVGVRFRQGELLWINGLRGHEGCCLAPRILMGVVRINLASSSRREMSS